MLKTLEDNFSELDCGGDSGLSSKIEFSVGIDFYGNGAKWILDIDPTKASFSDFLKAIQDAPGIPKKFKEKAKEKIKSV